MIFGAPPAREEEAQQYGRLASGRDLAKELRRGDLEGKPEPAATAEEPPERFRVPQRYARAAGGLSERLRKQHADLLPRRSKATRKLERYMEALGEAESRREAHQVFRRAWGFSAGPGKLQKLERKLADAQQSLYRRYEGGEIGGAKFRREEGALRKSFRDLRRLSRWR